MIKLYVIMARMHLL